MAVIKTSIQLLEEYKRERDEAIRVEREARTMAIIWSKAISMLQDLTDAERKEGMRAKLAEELTHAGLDGNLVVTLDDKVKFRCTPEHLIMLSDGSYKEAQGLQPNDSLSPLFATLHNPKVG